ncbi:MAG TPA: hypothetical protein VF365_05995 [Candidatus Limnocylindria bacterium]
MRQLSPPTVFVLLFVAVIAVAWAWTTMDGVAQSFRRALGRS